MSSVNKVIGIDNNNNRVVKSKQLPNLKKWALPEFEGTRCNLLEVVLGLGVPCEHFESSDEPTNTWVKVLNGLWDNTAGALRKHEAPAARSSCVLRKQGSDRDRTLP